MPPVGAGANADDNEKAEDVEEDEDGGDDEDDEEEEEGDEEEDEGEDNDDDFDDAVEGEEGEGDQDTANDTNVGSKASSGGKKRSSNKVAVGVPSSPSAVLKVRPRPRKPDDLAAASMRITQQKRLGRAWGGGDDGTDERGGPRIDLAHLAYVQEDFSRRTDAVAQLRTRMAAKSRPGYELRVQRRWDCASVSRMVLRRHFAWLPCVVATMMDAVWDGDILQVHSLLLEKREVVNFRDPRTGQRALNLAIQQQHEPIVRLLLDRGADVNEPDADSGGALLAPVHNALIMGNKALFRRLLKAGANPEQQDGEGFTPLLWASARGYLEVAAQLVETHGADVNHQDVLGWTPLHIACFKGYADMVDYLLVERGARTDVEDANGFTPFMFARIAEHRDIIERLDAHAATMERKRLQRLARLNNKSKVKAVKKTKKSANTSPKRMFVTSKN